MKPSRVSSITVVVVLLLMGCSSTPGGRRARVDRNVITAAEMQSAAYTDAYLVVQSLRPLWLKTRGVSSITQREIIKVYLDDSLLGGPEYLKQITTRSIATIRFLDANQATQRWGLDHGMGAILVSTRPPDGSARRIPPPIP